MWDEVFHHQPHINPHLCAPLVLAYVGDAVHELYVRQYLLSIGAFKPHQLQRRSSALVSAKTQSAVLRQLMDQLSEEEQDIVRRGRNAKSGTVPKNTDVSVYRQSSGFESLLGYLFLTGQKERLSIVLDKALHIATELAEQPTKSARPKGE
jgi:ribonuclease-3 family protein